MNKYKLKILGKVSKAVIKKFDYKFNNPNSVFFVDFSEETIPIGTEFTKITNEKNNA